MKKILISAVLLISASVSAQLAVTSIENRHTELVINYSISIKKGNEIQIYLPAGKDFVFVKQKKSGLNAKLLGNIADVVGTAASAVGMGSGSIKMLQGATKVLRTANVVQYGADALDKIQELSISDNAKKIAGKKMEILDWEFTDDSYIIFAKIEKKKYEIYLQEAVMSGEVKL